MRTLLLVAVAVACTSANAEEVKLGCVTDRVWLEPGVPTTLVAGFDEERKTAFIFSSQLDGEEYRANDAMFFNDMIGFKFKTKAGADGSVTISRTDGSLTMKLTGSRSMSLMAKCRKEIRRF